MDKVFIFLIGIATALGVSLLLAFPTMLLWNWLIPKLFFYKIARIGFLEAWGINFLCSMLFKTQVTKKED